METYLLKLSLLFPVSIDQWCFHTFSHYLTTFHRCDTTRSGFRYATVYSTKWFICDRKWICVGTI